MSRRKSQSSARTSLVKELTLAGREWSHAAVMFHTKVAEKLALGPSEEKTLDLLERLGPMTAGDLVNGSGLAPASVTGIIDKLERRGYVRRRRDPSDGRRVIVEIDRAALREAGALFAGLMRRMDALYRELDEDELRVVLRFMREATARQREATEELDDG